MPDDIMDRGLPANLEAERFVLGSLLVNPALFPAIDAELNPADFTSRKNQLVFSALRKLGAAHGPIDAVTLVSVAPPSS